MMSLFRLRSKLRRHDTITTIDTQRKKQTKDLFERRREEAEQWRQQHDNDDEARLLSFDQLPLEAKMRTPSKKHQQQYSTPQSDDVSIPVGDELASKKARKARALTQRERAQAERKAEAERKARSAASADDIELV